LFKHLVTVAIAGEAHAVLEAPVELPNAVEMDKSGVIAYELAWSFVSGHGEVYKEIRSLAEVVSLLGSFFSRPFSLPIHDSIVQLLFILIFYRHIRFSYISISDVNFHICVSC
jgi:hypothetical protein